MERCIPLKTRYYLETVFILSVFLIYPGFASNATELEMVPVQTPVTATNGDSAPVMLQVRVNEIIQHPYSVFYYVHSRDTTGNTAPPCCADDGIYTYETAVISYTELNTNVTFFVSKTFDGKKNVSTEIILTLEDLVNLADFPTKIYKLEGDSGFEASCSATGNPPPNIRWKYSDDIGNLQQIDGEFKDPVLICDVTANKTLTLLSNKVLSFDNTGNYTCEAENSIENNTKTKKVDGTMELIVHIPVEFWSKSDDVNATINESTILACTFRSFPPPNETIWKFNGEEKLRGSNYISDEIFTTMYLELSSLQCEDEGNYSCEATNYVLEDEMRQSSSSNISIKFSDVHPVESLECTTDPCNGTYFEISWEEYPTPSNGISYCVSISPGNQTCNVMDSPVVTESHPNTTYMVIVTAVSTCNKSSEEKSTEVTTGFGNPSSPNNVTGEQVLFSTICNVTWVEPDITYNNISEYKIDYVVQNNANNESSVDSAIEHEKMYHEINMTMPNSDYKVSVTAINCAGESESTKAEGECFTDTTVPHEVTKIPPPAQTNAQGGAEVTGEFQTEIPEISQTNGEISCYLIVMVRYSILYDTSEDAGSERIQVNESNLASIADGSVDEIEDGQLYYAVASNTSGEVTIGDNTESFCTATSERKKIDEASGSDGYCALNRNLTANHSYDMFLLTIVPSIKNSNNYAKASDGTFFNVRYVPLPTILTSTAVSTDTTSPSSLSTTMTTTDQGSTQSDGQNLLAILVPIFVILLLISVGLGYWFYRNRKKTKMNTDSMSRKMESLEMEAEQRDSTLANEDIGEDTNESNTSTAPMLAPRPNGLSKKRHQVVTYENVSFKLDDENISTFIPTNEIYQEYRGHSANNNKGFAEEYNLLPLEFSQSREESLRPENLKKNRYTNIYPYDEARVVLPRVVDVENSDYINACYINGYSTQGKFIAAQGPMKKTVGDFWRMIYHYKCYSIVMVTGLIEKARVKCAQYWPSTLNSPETYGMLRVTLKEETLMIDYVIRKFELQKEGEPRQSQKRFVVTQYHFIGWPDHGVPQSATGILRLHRLVMRENPTNSGPIVVHCSAGVGRTGTFIALDILFEQMVKENGVDLVKTLTDLRKQRPRMVQVLDQYIFIYRAIADIAKYGNTEFEVSQIDYEVDELKKLKENSRIDGFGEEYAKLKDIEIIDRRIKTATLSVNRKRNRTATIVPYDRNRAYILDRKSGEMIYINASIVKGYRRKDAFITTQAPLEHTAAEFWKMILEYGSRIIVTLNAFDDSEKFKENPFQYWPDHNSTLELGDFLISCHKENVSGSFVTRDLNVKKTSDPNATGMDVTQYHFLSWKPKMAPNDGQGLLDMIAEIGRIQQNTTQNEAPIVVQCSDGSGRSGAFCAIMTLIETAKTEGIVDVFRTIRDLRQERTGMVDSPELFRFCYEILQVYVNSFGLYSNFK